MSIGSSILSCGCLESGTGDVRMSQAQQTPVEKVLTIGIIGTRGIPNRYGGFERFVELLVTNPCWQTHNVRFHVYGETTANTYNAWTQLCAVGFSKTSRPLMYYVKSVKTATAECDIVLCCGVGLSIFAFWPVLRGKLLVLNPDGCEWRRTKWSSLGRLLIRAMYWPALMAARRIVIDAEALREDFGSVLGSKTCYIGYQAPEPVKGELLADMRHQLGLVRPFVLVIARLEPENNILMILQAFQRLASGGVDLVIVGGTTTQFYKEVLEQFASSRLRFLGAIYDQQVLHGLRSNCIAYVHGHSVGGTNPSLLEALSTVCGHLLCHDNKYNREVAAGEALYFSDDLQLANLLEPLFQGAITVPTSHRVLSRDQRFHPDIIAQHYLELFKELYASS
jgi:rhamnosyltransferase